MRDAVLTTTIIKDLLQIAVAAGLFAIGAAALSDAAATPGDPASSISWHLLGSLGVGAVIGLLSRWPAERAGERIGLVTAGLGVTIAAVSAAAGLSPLLVGLAAGLMQANLWPERSARLFRSTQDIFLPVSVVFFANAGASIDVTALGLVWPVAVGLVATRLLLMWTAVTAGMRWAGVPARASRWAWTGFIAQAGVSLALAREFEATFAGFPFTATVTTLLVAIIAIHELIGPPLFAWGLRRAGEVPEDSA
jgi:Kef-type K+ transport system membrane component KefB